LISGLVEFSGSAYILHTATDSTSTPLMLISSIPDPVSSPPNLSDQYKAISRNVEMVALDLVSVLFALTKVLIAMSAGRSMAYRMFERWGISWTISPSRRWYVICRPAERHTKNVLMLNHRT